MLWLSVSVAILVAALAAAGQTVGGLLQAPNRLLTQRRRTTLERHRVFVKAHIRVNSRTC